VILAVDLRGYGETADVKQGGRYANDAFRTAMLAMHVGQPLLGQRIVDLIAAINFGQQHPLVDPDAIRVVAIGRTGPVALHAAVLDPQIRLAFGAGRAGRAGALRSSGSGGDTWRAADG
jgi:hypothetical protein